MVVRGAAGGAAGRRRACRCRRVVPRCAPAPHRCRCESGRGDHRCHGRRAVPCPRGADDRAAAGGAGRWPRAGEFLGGLGSARLRDLHLGHHRRAEGRADRAPRRRQPDHAGRRAVRARPRRSGRPGQFVRLRLVDRGDLAGARQRCDRGRARRRDGAFGARSGAVVAARTGHRVLSAADAAAGDGRGQAARRVARPSLVLRRRRGAAARAGVVVGRCTVARERLRPDRVHGDRGARPRAAGSPGHHRHAGATVTRRTCSMRSCCRWPTAKRSELCIAGPGLASWLPRPG